MIHFSFTESAWTSNLLVPRAKNSRSTFSCNTHCIKYKLLIKTVLTDPLRNKSRPPSVVGRSKKALFFRVSCHSFAFAPWNADEQTSSFSRQFELLLLLLPLPLLLIHPSVFELDRNLKGEWRSKSRMNVAKWQLHSTDKTTNFATLKWTWIQEMSLYNVYR